MNTPKVVSGIDAASLAAVQAFYDRSSSAPCRSSDAEEAELTKLLENTFRHVNIALVNELAMFAADLGIDVWEAIDAASTKPFGYMRFTPGPGVGGHCLPIDPRYLSWRVQRSRSARPSGSSSWPTTSTTTCPTTSCAGSTAALNQRRQRGQRLRGSCCWAWRTSRTPATPASRRPLAVAEQLLEHGRRGAGRRPARGRGRARSTRGVVLVDADRRRARRGRRRGRCSSTTTPSTSTSSPQTRAYVLDTRHRLTGPTVGVALAGAGTPPVWDDRQPIVVAGPRCSCCRR